MLLLSLNGRRRVLTTCCCENLSRCIKIDEEDAQPHNQSRPRRNGGCSDNTRGDDGDVGESVVSRRQERGTGKAAAVLTEPREQEGAIKIDAKCTKARSRQKQSIWRNWNREFLPRGPELNTPGTSRMADSAMPTRERRCALQPRARKIIRLTAVSSKKSTESANSDTEATLCVNMSETNLEQEFSVQGSRMLHPGQ